MKLKRIIAHILWFIEIPFFVIFEKNPKKKQQETLSLKFYHQIKKDNDSNDKKEEKSKKTQDTERILTREEIGCQEFIDTNQKNKGIDSTSSMASQIIPFPKQENVSLQKQDSKENDAAHFSPFFDEKTQILDETQTRNDQQNLSFFESTPQDEIRDSIENPVSKKEEILPEKEDQNLLFQSTKEIMSSPIKTIPSTQNIPNKDELLDQRKILKNQEQSLYKIKQENDAAILFEYRLYKECIAMDQMASNLRKKAEAQIEVREKIKYHFDFATQASLMLITTFTLAKKTKGMNSIALNLLIGLLALKVGRDLVKGKQDISYVKSYANYSNEINTALTSLDRLKKLATKEIKDLEAIEKEIEKEFGSFMNANKEYKNLLHSILLMTEKIKESKKRLEEQEENLHQSMKVTKEKVYQLEMNTK